MVSLTAVLELQLFVRPVELVCPHWLVFLIPELELHPLNLREPPPNSLRLEEHELDLLREPIPDTDLVLLQKDMFFTPSME